MGLFHTHDGYGAGHGEVTVRGRRPDMAMAPCCEEFAWGRMEWFADGADKGLSLARMVVQPGACSPAHRHPNCHEVIHVLAGEIAQRRDDHWAAMTAGDTITIYAGETHQSRNDSERRATLIIAYSSGERVYEEVAR